MGVIACKVCALVIGLIENGGKLGVYSGSL
jgi:hypothetical protein